MSGGLERKYAYERNGGGSRSVWNKKKYMKKTQSSRYKDNILTKTRDQKQPYKFRPDWLKMLTKKWYLGHKKIIVDAFNDYFVLSEAVK